MKIRIIGACGSGKTTLAKDLSNRYGISYFEIDNLIWDRTSDNKKYTEETRNSNLQTVLNLNSWIIEGVQIKQWTLKTIEDKKISIVLKKLFKPDGITICQNGGIFDELTHFHMHIVPRYEGQNFADFYAEETEQVVDELRLSETKRKIINAINSF